MLGWFTWLTWFALSVYSSEKPYKISKDEYEIKAGFFARFADYITWPDETDIDDVSHRFVIGIIGRSPISTYLETRLVPKGIRGKKVNIKYFTTPEEIDDCHILFIAKSAKKYLSQVLAITKNKPILTIGDTEGFCQEGVHINLVRDKQRVRFEMNPFTMRQASLIASAKLLKYAIIIKSQGEIR